MLYTLKIHNFISQIHLNEAKEKKTNYTIKSIMGKRETQGNFTTLDSLLEKKVSSTEEAP